MTPISALPSTGQPEADRQEKLQEAAQAFEAIFLRNMIATMRQSSLGDGLLDSSASDQFRDIMDERLADDMAHYQGVGIAKLLLAQWARP